MPVSFATTAPTREEILAELERRGIRLSDIQAEIERRQQRPTSQPPPLPTDQPAATTGVPMPQVGEQTADTMRPMPDTVPQEQTLRVAPSEPQMAFDPMAMIDQSQREAAGGGSDYPRQRPLLPQIKQHGKAIAEHRLGEVPGMKAERLTGNIADQTITAGANIVRNLVAFGTDQIPQIADAVLNSQSPGEAMKILEPFITFPANELAKVADGLFLSYLPNYFHHGKEVADKAVRDAWESAELAPEGPAMGLAALAGGVRGAPKMYEKGQAALAKPLSQIEEVRNLRGGTKAEAPKLSQVEEVQKLRGEKRVEAPALSQIDEVRKLRGKGEAQKTVEGDYYTSVELGALGTPQTFKDLGATVTSAGRVVADKGVPEFMKQARNRVKLEDSKTLFRKIEMEADPKMHRRAGGKLEELRKQGMKKLTDEQAATKLADDIEAGKAPEYNKIMDEMWGIAKAKGVKVSGYIKNYFPRMMQKKVGDTLWDDLLSIEKKHKGLQDLTITDIEPLSRIIEKAVEAGEFKDQTKIALLHIMKTGQAKNFHEAFRQLKSRTYEDLFNPFGNIESKRTLDLPLDFYERNAKKVLPRYVMGWAKRVAEVETFGRDGKVALDLLNKIHRIDPSEAKIAKQVLDSWSGALEREPGRAMNPKLRKVSDAFTASQVGTKIAMGWATMLNVTQTGISTAALAGWKNTLKGIAKLADPKRRSDIRSSGSTLKTAMEAIAGYEPQGLMGKFADRMTTVSGFRGINKVNQYVAASTAMEWLPKLHRTAQGKGRLAKRAQARLADFGVDYNTKLTDKKLQEGMYRFATDTQLQKNVLSDPLMANDPRVRPLFLFKRFGGRQVVLIKDHIWKKEFLQHKNPLPLLRLVSGGIIGGEMINWAKNQVKTVLSGEDMSREDKGIFDRAIDDLAAVGAMGYIFDMFSAEDKFRQVVWQSTPIQASETIKLIDLIYQINEDATKYGALDVAQRAIKPLSKLTGSIPAQAAKRLRTPSQKKGELTVWRTRARGDFFKALASADIELSLKIYRDWNKKHPRRPLFKVDEDPLKLTIEWKKRQKKRRDNP